MFWTVTNGVVVDICWLAPARIAACRDCRRRGGGCGGWWALLATATRADRLAILCHLHPAGGLEGERAVNISADRTVTTFAGGGSTQYIIDVAGYFN